MKIFTSYFRYFFLISSLTLISCKDKTTYDKTKAVSAFENIAIVADPEMASIEVDLPAQTDSNFFNGARGQQVLDNSQSVQNFLLNPKLLHLKSIWSGYITSFPNRFVFSPATDGEKIYLLDSSGILSSRDLKNKKKIWSKRIFPKLYFKSYQTPKIFLSPKNEHGERKIYAITGSNQIAAVNPVDGTILWTKSILSIPVSTPIADNKLVYLITSDNKLYALRVDTGEIEWVHSGIARSTAIFGSADPVLYKDLVIASYSSGELYALGRKNGEVIWTEDLNLNKAVSSDFYLNDIDATPIIDEGTEAAKPNTGKKSKPATNAVIFSIGNGGLMKAINLSNGGLLWKIEISSVSNFWLARNFLYVITSDDKLFAIHKTDGKIKWITQLPELKEKDQPQTKVVYDSVVMAGGELIIIDTNGIVLTVSPINGQILHSVNLHHQIYHSPIIINSKLYLHGMARFGIDLVELSE